MKYYMHHKYGISEDYNTFEQHPWHGVGQGTADAALWYIALLDTLINAYHTKIQPWIIQDPTLTLMVIKSLKAFIDDVAMSAGGEVSIAILMACTQAQLQWWNSPIQANRRSP